MGQTEKAILKISQSKEKLEEFIIDTLENCTQISNALTEKDLANISGGKSNFNKKLMSTALSALTILPTAAPLAGAVVPFAQSSAQHAAQPSAESFDESSDESTLGPTLERLESVKNEAIKVYDEAVFKYGDHPVFDISDHFEHSTLGPFYDIFDEIYDVASTSHINDGIKSKLIEVNTAIFDHIIDTAENVSPGFKKRYEDFLTNIRPLLDPTLNKARQYQIIKKIASDISENLSNLGDSISDNDLKNLLGIFSLAKFAELMTSYYINCIEDRDVPEEDAISGTTMNLLVSTTCSGNSCPKCHPLLLSYIMAKPKIHYYALWNFKSLPDCITIFPKNSGINPFTAQFGGLHSAALTQIYLLADSLPGVEFKFTNNLADSITKIINDTTGPLCRIIFTSAQIPTGLSSINTEAVMNNINSVLEYFHNKIMTAAEQQITSRFPSLLGLQTSIIGTQRLLDPNNDITTQANLTVKIATATVSPDQLSDQFQLFRLSILNQILIRIRDYFKDPKWITDYRTFLRQNNDLDKSSSENLSLLKKYVRRQLNSTINEIFRKNPEPPMFDLINTDHTKSILGSIEPLAFIRIPIEQPLLDINRYGSCRRPDNFNTELSKMINNLEKQKKCNEKFCTLYGFLFSYLDFIYEVLPFASVLAQPESYKPILQQRNTDIFNALMDSLSAEDDPSVNDGPYGQLNFLLCGQPLYSSDRTPDEQRAITRKIFINREIFGDTICECAILAEILLRTEQHPLKCTIIAACTDPELRSYVNQLGETAAPYLYSFFNSISPLNN